MSKFYEVEGAVFRKRSGLPLEIMDQKSGKFGAYSGDKLRVYEKSHPLSLDQVRDYMDVEPDLSDEDTPSEKQ